MEIEIIKLDNYGRGICYIDNKITFVNNALPSEIVKIEIIKRKSKYNEANVISYIKKSSKRIDPECKHYNKCGGCNLMHISYEEELKFKEQKIKDILYKYAHIPNELVKKIIPNDNMNYRNKATFKVNNEIGYFSSKTNKIVSIDECLIIDKRINELLKEIKQLDLKDINEITIRISKDEELVIFKGKNININFLSAKNIVLNNGDLKILKGNDYIIDEIGKYKFYVSANSFFQVNKYNTIKLYDKILEYVKESENLLDLYCGTGSIGIYLNEITNKLIGVEINQNAINDANKNINLNNLKNINFVCLDTEQYNILDNFDTIIVDPPRSGLGKKTINYLLNINPLKIVYVSCNPITLARDINFLSDKYKLLEATPIDMFSRTYHCETICVLERK